MGRRRYGFFALALAVLPVTAAAECRQALALGLDVSGSVDLREYRLQLDGLVAALNAPNVVRSLLSSPEIPVALMVYEWSGPFDQAILVPWTPISSREALAEVSNALALAERRNSTPGTALGTAMQFGAFHLMERSTCLKRTLDISGDGKSNLGPPPENVRTNLKTLGITVNALVIGSDAAPSGDRRQVEIGELSSYFRANVITGPEAFVETAIGFEDYAAAMTRKLERELESVVMGSLQ